MIFEKNKFLQLLEIKMRFTTKMPFTGTNPTLNDFINLHELTYDEFLRYQALLEENIFRNSRNAYIQILEDFIQ